MTSRRTTSKQSCKVSSTQPDKFVHECTCNVALKQFRKDIKQLESNTRSCNCPNIKPCRKHVQPCKTKQMTPIKGKQATSKSVPQTPTKNKTWFEVLAESPKKPAKERNEINGCDSSCKYAAIFSNTGVTRYDEKSKTNKIKQFDLLMDILSKKLQETSMKYYYNFFII